VPRPRPEEQAVRDALRDVGSAPASAGAEGSGSPPSEPDFVEAPSGPPAEEAEPGEVETPPAADGGGAEPEPADPAEEAGPGADGSVTDTVVAEDQAAPDVAALERERDGYLDLARRTQADFENFRKRAARDARNAGTRGRASVALEILPAVDNLERALEAAGGDSGGGLAHGVQLVLDELMAGLRRSGIEAFEPAGEPFDPNVHEAISTRAVEGTEAGVVLDVVQKGYRHEETVLRPARVVVSAQAT